MRRKQEWRDATNGPDHLDVETMMRAMGALHSGVVSIAFAPIGIGPSGGVLTTAEIHFHTLPGSSLPMIVGATANWPCNQCKSFWGHLYHLLHRLDYEISKAYKNEALWQ